MIYWLLLIISFAFARPWDNPSPANVTQSAVISTSIDILASNGSENLPATSSFRTLVYVPPSTAALSSLTGRGLLQPRLLYHCRSATATFHHSHCIHRSGQAGGMQRYIIYCREEHTVDPGHLHSPLPLGETGICRNDEICVDSWVGDPHTGLSLARCVPQDAFKSMDSIDDDLNGTGQGTKQEQGAGSTPPDADDDSEEDNSGHVGGEKRRKLDHGFSLGGKQASVVVSQADASTPMGVDKMELNAIGNEVSTSMCQDCFEIRTKRLAPNTTELNMQASLASAGTIAAGMMWVALFSG